MYLITMFNGLNHFWSSCCLKIREFQHPFHATCHAASLLSSRQNALTLSKKCTCFQKYVFLPHYRLQKRLTRNNRTWYFIDILPCFSRSCYLQDVQFNTHWSRTHCEQQHYPHCQQNPSLQNCTNKYNLKKILGLKCYPGSIWRPSGSPVVTPLWK